MNAQPIISVIMPVYNSQRYIGKAIKSILYQTFKEFELLIVDDGSIDNSVLKILSFNDDRIILFRKQHQGLVETMNYCLRQSRTEWIAVMHSDDISDCRRLELQFNFISRRKNVVLGSSYYVIDENDKILYKASNPGQNNEIKKKLLFQNVIIHSSVMFNKKHIINHGAYGAINNTEDYDLWLRLFPDTEFYNIPTPLLHYRKHNESLSSSRENKKYTDRQCYCVLKRNSRNIIKQKDLEIYEGIWNVLYNSVPAGRKLILKNIINRTIPIKYKMKYLLMSLLGRNIIDLYYYFNPKLRLYFKFSCEERRVNGEW